MLTSFKRWLAPTGAVVFALHALASCASSDSPPTGGNNNKRTSSSGSSGKRPPSGSVDAQELPSEDPPATHGDGNQTPEDSSVDAHDAASGREDTRGDSGRHAASASDSKPSVTPDAGQATSDDGNPPTSTTKCPGTPVDIDWAHGGWMAPDTNQVITGAWYTYFDKKSSSITPAPGTDLTSNCVEGAVGDCTGCWGAGLGFETGIKGATWARPPAGICLELEVTGAASLVAEFSNVGVDPHKQPPYGKELVNGVNKIDLGPNSLAPTWGSANYTFDSTKVDKVQLKFGQPAGPFKLCVKAMTTY